MKFSDESRFYLDNINAIKDTFVLKSYSYIYFFHFLLKVNFMSDFQFQQMMSKLNEIGNYLCEIDYIVDTIIPDLLFKQNKRNSRIILLSINHYCITFFGYGENIYGNALRLW